MKKNEILNEIAMIKENGIFNLYYGFLCELFKFIV